MSHYCVSGTTHTTECCMNASTMALVPKEDSKCTYSLLEIFLIIILTHTFSRHEPKHLLVPRVEKAKASQSWLRVYFTTFCNLIVHFVKFFRSFTTEVIKNIIGMLLHFISWDGWLYMGPGRVRFQGEVEVSFNPHISCTWRVIVFPYLRHLCLVLDGIR